MATIQQLYKAVPVSIAKRESVITRFIDWCAGQETYRFGWVAAIIAIHGCVLTPITVLTIAATHNSISSWGVAIGAMAMSLVSNLSAMPTRITIPVFFASILIDLVVIGVSIASVF